MRGLTDYERSLLVESPERMRAGLHNGGDFWCEPGTTEPIGPAEPADPARYLEQVGSLEVFGDSSRPADRTSCGRLQKHPGARPCGSLAFRPEDETRRFFEHCPGMPGYEVLQHCPDDENNLMVFVFVDGERVVEMETV